MLSESTNSISSFIKYNRSKLRFTQQQLAQKAGVGLRFIRELEQGKQTLRMDKVNQVLNLFGYHTIPGNERTKDPYEILMNYFNKNVRILLKNKKELVGFITKAVYENNEIRKWQFVSNNNAVEYKKTENTDLLQTLVHTDIETIENA